MSERGGVVRASVRAPAPPVDDTADLGAAPPDPWDEYLAALRELDRVRRAAAQAAADEAAAARAAAGELARVQSRLAAQRDRLDDLAATTAAGPPGAGRVLASVPRLPGLAITPPAATPLDLRPSAAEVAAAESALRPVASSVPAAALAALRLAQDCLHTVDAELDAAGPARAGEPAAPEPAAPLAAWPPAVRNLLVYGPLAMLVLLLQIGLLAASSDGAPAWPAAACALVLPVLAYGVGWVGVGLVPWGRGEPVDRTPLVGALVCLGQVLVACASFGAILLLR
ncbi:MAG TPA: hypothetical protein VFB84_20240 [Micromonosporaceae bacterium]|nr:hypothetical protein [Micromonosporaceae bacterium]